MGCLNDTQHGLVVKYLSNLKETSQRGNFARHLHHLRVIVENISIQF
jgi:hypothetical protein